MSADRELIRELVEALRAEVARAEWAPHAALRRAEAWLAAPVPTDASCRYCGANPHLSTCIRFGATWRASEPVQSYTAKSVESELDRLAAELTATRAEATVLAHVAALEAQLAERDAEVARHRVWHHELQQHLSYLHRRSGCRRIHTRALGERDCVLDTFDRLAAELADAQARVVELGGYVGTQDRECEEEKK